MRSFRGAMWALVIGVGVGMGAASADAKSVYRWETDEGVVSFADEMKRVPERYRAGVRKINTNTLTSAKRFTEVGESAKAAHADKVAARLSRLRGYNEDLAAPVRAGRRGGSDSFSIATAGERRFVPRLVEDSTGGDPVRERRSGRNLPDIIPNLNFSPDPNSDEPVVVEKKRVRTAGAVTTQTITVIRQGDTVLGVIKPRPNSHSAHAWETDPY